jgi:hypothetical protein
VKGFFTLFLKKDMNVLNEIKNEPFRAMVFKQVPSVPGVFGGDTPRTPRKKKPLI